MLVDSHCHLPKVKEEVHKIIEEANAEGVVKFICVGTHIKDSQHAIFLAEKLAPVFATIGIYPHEEQALSLDQMKAELQQLLQTSKKIVAIGECGIDISNWEGGRTVDDQLPIFEMQIQLALENDLPIIIHNRNGDELVLKTLQKYKSPKLRGIAHCFASSWEVAQQFVDLNFYISFSGLITYPSRKDLLETVKNVPNDKFLVETDSPYLPPQGHRGEKNEPKYVKIVAQKVAETRQQTFEETCKLAYENTCRIFGPALFA